MSHRHPAAVAAIALALLCTAPAGAAIISGPDVISPPAVLGPNPFGANRFIAFYERQNVVLGENVDLGNKVSRKLARAKGGRDAKAARMLSEGTLVSSHYIAYDPAGTVRNSVTVAFDSEILGVVVGSNRLARTDFLGAEDIDYGRFRHRGKEWRDHFKISADGKSLTLKYRANSPGDYVRVITAGTDTPPPPPPAAPEPGAALLFGLGAAAVARFTGRRRLPSR